MKKLVMIFTIFTCLSFILISNKEEKNKDKDIKQEKKVEKANESKKDNKKEMRALFVSYMELNTYIRDKTKEESLENIKKIIKNTKSKKFNTIILQVRSFDDAIYKSSEFPINKSIILKDGSYYDVLKTFIDETSKNKIDLYVWINPFRITRKNEEISPDSYAYQFINTNIVKKIEDIYYYNPSSKEATTHIINGIKEILKNYEFKGILFDDYFYPNDDIDNEEYQEYVKHNGDISKSDYHLQVINNLIKEVYKSIKSINKNVSFGISPDGNIENNYNKNYADVRKWGKSDEYVDFLMPQLYYGFYNSSRPFIDTMNEWNDIVTNKNIELYYALAFYKIGKEDTYAREGKQEWIENNDIIKRQIILGRNTSKYKGFALFRYDNLFNEEYYTVNTIKELENLDEVIYNQN